MVLFSFDLQTDSYYIEFKTSYNRKRDMAQKRGTRFLVLNALLIFSVLKYKKKTTENLMRCKMKTWFLGADFASTLITNLTQVSLFGF